MKKGNKRPESVHLNGKLLPAAGASVSVFDRGLMYGDGLFETMKAVDGHVVRLRDHLARLRGGLKALGIAAGAAAGIDSAIGRLLKANGLQSGQAYIKVLVTRGGDAASAASGHKAPKGIKPTVVITARALDEKAIRRLQEKGVEAVFVTAFGPALPGIKSLNYLTSVLAKSEAVKKRAYEALFVDHHGFITEGSSTNLFVVKNGIVSTPPAAPAALGEFGALAGVTRAAVIKAAKKLGLAVREEPVRAEDLLIADEAFITNSIIDVVPLVRVSGNSIGSGKPGEATGRIAAKVAVG